MREPQNLNLLRGKACPVKKNDCDTVRESEANYLSPVVASMSCSLQPAALHIAPAARLRGFCLYDSALGELICEDDGDSLARALTQSQIILKVAHQSGMNCLGVCQMLI
jgi:hypothetical protein